MGDTVSAPYFNARQITISHMGNNGLVIKNRTGVNNHFCNLDYVYVVANGNVGFYLRGATPSSNAGSARMVIAKENGSTGIYVSGVKSWQWDAITASYNGTKGTAPGMRFDDGAMYHIVMNGNFEGNNASGGQVEFKAASEANAFIRFGLRPDEVQNLGVNNRIVLSPTDW